MTQPTQTQRTLFEPDRDELVDPVVEVSGDEVQEMTPAEKFAWFHKNNPAVYAMLVRMARRVRRYRLRWSMKGAFEVLRYLKPMRASTRNEKFKLNNNYTPYYARLIMKNEPDLADLFRTRGDEEEGS